MTREIAINRIVDDKFKKEIIQEVKKATLLATEQIKRFTPEDTGNLMRSWQTDIKDFVGEVSTNVEYAEPVAYGTNLPPSWGGVYRTNKDTIKGYPELIAKQIAAEISRKFSM